jgi:hypothetical protein
MSTEAPHIDTSCRAELEKTEQWYRDRGDLRGAARVRRYIDYIALPAKQRRAIDAAVELRSCQLYDLAALCEDPDIALLAADELMSDSAADGLGIRLSDGTDIYGADISRDRDDTSPTGFGPLRLEIWSDGWPYRRPTISSA